MVTGSSRGIGRAVAVQLARQGADIWVHYLNNQEGAEETARMVRDAGGEAWVVKAHLKYPEEIEQLFSQVKEKHGRLDILINNAASGKLTSVMTLNKKGWEWCMDINARSALLTTQLAVPLMEAGKWGRVVNLTSLGSQRYIPDYAAIGASKAALEALTRYLAVELAPRGIVVNSVAGGLVDTDAIKNFPRRETMIENAQARIPMGRLGTPEDLARVVGFLCSDDAGWICGQTLIADGGYSLIS